MTGREQHLPTDRLTALAFIARAPQDRSAESADETLAFEHLAHCDECAGRYTQLVVDADSLRDVAFAQADEVFDDAMLDAQRTRILDRLAHLGQTARVISFPAKPREAVLPVSSNGRRWISVAAAAGLIIGLLAGQLLHFVPTSPRNTREDTLSMQSAGRTNSPSIVPASATLPALSDDELMEEVEAAIELRRAQSLRAIDALTPTAAEMLAMGRE
jgi:hypothetical protein